MKLLLRTQRLLKQLLIGVDQLVQTLLFGLPYLIRGGHCPSADETISSVVGRNANKGNPVAEIAEEVIDFLFGLLGEKNHCQNSIETLTYYD